MAEEVKIVSASGSLLFLLLLMFGIGTCISNVNMERDLRAIRRELVDHRTCERCEAEKEAEKFNENVVQGRDDSN